MFEGGSPQYSNDNKYIAFAKKSNGASRIIEVRELGSDKLWTFKANRLHYFRFSPDDKYTAIEQESKKYMKDYEIIVWDFKNNKKGRL